MTKIEMIQMIIDKTQLDEGTVKKVLDACEEVLATAVIEKMSQATSKPNLVIPKRECAKIIQLRQKENSKHKTN